MKKAVLIAAFTSIVLVSIAAVIGQRTSSLDPTVRNEAVIVSQGNVEWTKNPSDGTSLSHADLRQITRTQEAPKVRSQYRRQKAKDDARGINNLGMMLLNGVGEDRDLVEAFHLFTLAAEAGDAEAINNLGRMYEMGWGTPADTKTAIELYAKALRKGSLAARMNFRRLAHAAATADRESSVFPEAATGYRRPKSTITQNKARVGTSPITKQIEVFPSNNLEATRGSTGAISTRSKLDIPKTGEVTSDSNMLERRKAARSQKSRKVVPGITPPSTRRMQAMRPAHKEAARNTSRTMSAECRRFRRDGRFAARCGAQQIDRIPPWYGEPWFDEPPPWSPFWGGFVDY